VTAGRLRLAERKGTDQTAKRRGRGAKSKKQIEREKVGLKKIPILNMIFSVSNLCIILLWWQAASLAFEKEEEREHFKKLSSLLPKPNNFIWGKSLPRTYQVLLERMLSHMEVIGKLNCLP